MRIRFFPTATASVYTADADGAFTVLDREGLPCRLFPVGQDSPTVRAELVGRARFQHDPSYRLPPRSQVEVDGVRWNVEVGTVQRRPSGPNPVLGAADVVRATGVG